MARCSCSHPNFGFYCGYCTVCLGMQFGNNDSLVGEPAATYDEFQTPCTGGLPSNTCLTLSQIESGVCERTNLPAAVENADGCEVGHNNCNGLGNYGVCCMCFQNGLTESAHSVPSYCPSGRGRTDIVGHVFLDAPAVSSDCQSIGRCCYGNPESPQCANTTPCACVVGLDGVWTRGTTCEQSPCISGCCCGCDWSCNMTSAECTAAGGLEHRSTTCTNNACGLPKTPTCLRADFIVDVATQSGGCYQWVSAAKAEFFDRPTRGEECVNQRASTVQSRGASALARTFTAYTCGQHNRRDTGTRRGYWARAVRQSNQLFRMEVGYHRVCPERPATCQ